MKRNSIILTEALAKLIGEEAWGQYDGHPTTDDLAARLQGHVDALMYDDFNEVFGWTTQYRYARARRIRQAIKILKTTHKGMEIQSPMVQLEIKWV